ncbi:MAG: N-acetyl-gamma-glutamyl-phosphate reductase [Oscillospiraceae bacterium]|jgi:N-acetyl-gamma-glutamyl-phosphate reductase|nr:N-acetyl-gamma-glutamyl-phosphate reductase [Oscillospiraceae bacterium]
MAYKIFIDGSAGTTGLQLAERLTKYISAGAVEITALPRELRKNDAAKASVMNTADLVFLCLPDEAARASVALITNPSVKVIDTSTAHRVSDDWVYGFSELSAKQKQAICGTTRLSNPGCHATGAIAILAPLTHAGIIPPDYPIAITSVSGYTGGGKSAIAEYEDADRSAEYDAPRAYALTARHKHIPEIIKYAGLTKTPAFIPLICDFPQGMQVMIPLCLPGKRRQIFETLSEHYSDAPDISVTDDIPIYASGNEHAGTDKLTLRVAGNDETILITAQFDNLGKGAAGAALQNMRLMLGLDERK